MAELSGDAITNIKMSMPPGSPASSSRRFPRSAFAAGLLHAWNQTYCRPPLSEHELKQIFDRIANREAERLERMQ